ncbi:MAG: ribosome small subunit-dependent GTPase A [Mycoplasmoidaceae bacterium]
MNKAIVLKSISGISTLKDLNSSKIFLAELKGSLLNKKKIIYPGDYVEYINNESTKIITNVIDRKNFLNRPKIANIDYLIIVNSITEPKASIRMINKYILFFQSQFIDNIILYFTKFDLLKEDEIKDANKLLDHFKNDNYICYSSEEYNYFLDFLNSKKSNIICFTGQSGVGKSTLLNMIDKKFNIKTNEISKALNSGKHTTTATNLLAYENGYLVDTPGFSTVNLNVDKLILANGYKDFREASINCKFNNCLHKEENNCAIKSMVDRNIISKKRYDDYLFFLNNISNKK